MATRDQEDDLTQISRVTQTSREQGRKERVFKKCGQAVQRLFQMAVQSSSSATSLLSNRDRVYLIDYESENECTRLYRPVNKG